MVRKPRNRQARAVGYVRVSTAGQASEGVSLEAQETRIRAYCTLQDLDLVDVIVDAGESGKSLDRPGVQVVLNMVKARQVDAVVIIKLDRLFRNALDALNTSQEFARRGVALCSISEQLDTSTAAGKCFFTVIAAFAEMERGMAAERTRAGLAQTRKNGKQVGDKTPYGYDLVDGRLAPNPDEQEIISFVNEQYAAGIGLRKIAQDLNGRGIPTKTGAGQWYPMQVKRLLDRADCYPTE